MVELSALLLELEEVKREVNQDVKLGCKVFALCNGLHDIKLEPGLDSRVIDRSPHNKEKDINYPVHKEFNHEFLLPPVIVRFKLVFV